MKQINLQTCFYSSFDHQLHVMYATVTFVMNVADA